MNLRTQMNCQQLQWPPDYPGTQSSDRLPVRSGQTKISRAGGFRLQRLASWLNQVEIWFNRITQQAIRRGTFSNVEDLVEKIDHYVKNSNRRAQPFVWTATADSIFAKVERLCERIYGTAH